MFYSILYVLPKNIISWTFGKFAELKKPKTLIQIAISFFAKKYKINLSEAEKSLESYESLNEFFTRKLKPGVRHLGNGVVHPADAVITQWGRIQEGTLIQAKGKSFFLKEFLKVDSHYERFFDGYFFTYYLCPTDYHRVHSPVKGYITHVHAIPGMLWPVNSWSTSNIDNLFSINERVVTLIETENGHCAAVMVGATNVGKMTLSFDPNIKTNSFWNRKNIFKKYNSLPIQKGQELGTFHMGSTVVMIYEKSFFAENSNFQTGPVKVLNSLQI